VLGAQSSKSSLVDDLGDSMGICKMEDLPMKEIVHVKEGLGQEPILLAIQWCVHEIRPSIGLDRQGKKVAGYGIDVEVCRAGRRIPFSLFLNWVFGLVAVVG